MSDSLLALEDEQPGPPDTATPSGEDGPPPGLGGAQNFTLANPGATFIWRRPPIVYADGVFDLFHPGHLSFLQRAKEIGGLGAVLLVGVITDEDAQWKRRPIMAHAERVAMVRACSYVTCVVEKPPLALTSEFLDKYSIDLVVHGDDSKQEEFFRVPIERGIMRYVPYTRGVSTTEIIERVLASQAK